MKRVTFDFETRSVCNLKTSGAYKYSLDPTTNPTCLAAKFYDEDKVWFLDFHQINTPWVGLPQEFRSKWRMAIRDGYEFSAHNAFFEKCIYANILVKRYGWPDIPNDQYRCTAAKAAACALPRNLEGAGLALNLSTQKDSRGYVAMMATCKPTKDYNAWQKMRADIMVRNHIGKKLTPKQIKWLNEHKPHFYAPPMFLEPEANPSIWSVLYEYCKIDVLAEEQLDMTLPDLSAIEREVWFLNQCLNWRGVPFDEAAVKKIVTIMEAKTKEGLEELDTLTMGLITKPGAIRSILEFLSMEGVKLPNLQAKTIDDALQELEMPENSEKLLHLRKLLSLASLKKYKAMLARGVEGRLQDILLYHGASTGRDSAKGMQLQNLPRGLIKIDKRTPYDAIENIIDCDRDTLELLYGQNLGPLFSTVLRNILTSSKDCELFVADFSKIEVAVLWWMSGNEPGLEVLRSGKDPYIYQASANTGKDYDDITESERALGKAQVLGCGFGLGATRFQLTAWTMHRLKLTEDESLHAVTSYRKANEAVPKVWRQYEHAAMAAIENPKKIFTTGKCQFHMKNNFLWVKLPSGRKLAYYAPQVLQLENQFGYTKPTLIYMAVNSKTKKWDYERNWGGGLTENVVQATARDLLMYGLLRLEKAKYRCLFAVHDEAVCEREIGEGDLEEFKSILCETPTWGEGLPIEASGWMGPRYRKG